MPSHILGIDLGSWSVKAVLLESTFRGHRVEGVREVPLSPGGAETKSERQLEALQELLVVTGFKADTQIAALPGELASTRFVNLPFSDPKKVEATIGGELADLLPFDVMDAVYDHQVQAKRPDGSTLSICGAAQRHLVREHLDTLKEGDVDPRFLPIDVLQLYNLYTHFLQQDSSKAEAPGQASEDAGTFVVATPDAPPDGRLVVDIGHERTLVCACGDEGIVHARVLRAGGRDVTQAIAEAYQLDWAAAEDGKHEEALVVASRYPASSDESQKMSEVCSLGLKPLVRELRRTLQAIRREKRIRVARIDLVGGGSRIRNLAPYLAEQLNVPVAQGIAVEQSVERLIDGRRRPAYACAMALALRATSDAPVSRIDLRKGEMSFAGQLQNLRKRIPAIAIGAAVMLVLAGINVAVRYHLVSKREAAVDEQFCAITQEVVGRRICEPAIALSVLRQPTSELGSFKIPEKSAFRVAAEISHRSPKDVDVTLTEMDLRPDKARIVGTTASFDAVDQIVGAYAEDPCMENIRKGNLNKRPDGTGVEFQLSMDLRCSQ
ncbi:MAG: pilus assembly protein PilM [Myxococcales bacterium]|nr:pilus assembly protein PilM [Myxococcales bacterium]